MKKLFKIDLLILICSILLLGIGLFTLYSVTNAGSANKQVLFQKEFTNQLIFALLGIVLSIFVFVVSPLYFKFKFTLGLLYIFTLGLLIATLFLGTDVRGVKRWITIGSQIQSDGSAVGGITIQASEFAKISIIILSAALLAVPVFISEELKTGSHKIKRFLIQNQMVLVTIGLNLILLAVVYAQKSLSVTVVIGVIMATILFASLKNKFDALLVLLTFVIMFVISTTVNDLYKIGLATRILLGILLSVGIVITFFIKKNLAKVLLVAACIGGITGSIILSFAWNNVLPKYQKARFETFFNKERDIQAEGFQQEQSKISIGAGQIFGQGFRQATDARILSLPEPTTDFIFAIFGYKFGFIGAIIIIALYLLLTLRIFYLADKMNDKFSSLVLIGVGVMILSQFFFNLGMNLDILPVGGTTLPLVSYGGSSLITIMIGIALCENIIATNKLEENVYRRRDKILINGWNY